MGLKSRKLGKLNPKVQNHEKVILKAQRKKRHAAESPSDLVPSVSLKRPKLREDSPDQSPAVPEPAPPAPPAPEAEPETTDNGFLTDQVFEDLAISQSLKTALAEMKFDKMTAIQAKGIPPALKGHDILGAAKTGSGKTLAFLIPAIELLEKTKFAHTQGTGVLIISPTRELSLQIYNVAKELMKHTQFTNGLIMGGTNMKAEVGRLEKHVNLLVCTPGRLLDHLLNTRTFLFKNLVCLIIDEADLILKQGFEEHMNQILQILPRERQTILYSATQTKKVEDLCRVSLNDPIIIGLAASSLPATVAGLEQGYAVVEGDKKFLLLFTFLRKNLDKKVMVFFSSCASVKYHSDLLNYVDVPAKDIHGKQKQTKRVSVYYDFCKADKGILLCTDVAARGLDIPAVDWIVQYDPPDDPEAYIHRVGRTARAELHGKALLLLLPQELGFLRYLKKSNVPLNEYEFGENKLANIQTQFERLIEKNYHLHVAAKSAYRGYLLAYSSHQHKDIFDVNQLDLLKVGKSFGFTIPPKVTLNLNTQYRPGKRGADLASSFYKRGSGLSFSNRNPQGHLPEGDARQFSR